jgi:hypothetical protein
VPAVEVRRFEQIFPGILKAKGFAREAEQLAGFERFYWAVQRAGGLYIRGSLVCRDRLTGAGVVLLEPTCPSIDVSFPAGHPQQVEFLIDSPVR